MSRTILKKGFYVSPCGCHIIELIQSRGWKHGWDIIVMDDAGYVDNIGDVPKEDGHIIFGVWMRLK